MRVLLLLFSATLLSCSSDQHTINTLDREIDNRILASLRTINGMKSVIKDKGNRSDDVEVLRRSKNFLKSKRTYGMPSKVNEFDSKFNISKAIQFVDSIKTGSEDWLSKVDNKLFSDIQLLSENKTISSRVRNRLVYLGILKLESIYLDENLKRAVGGCNLTFCFTFDLYTDSDTISIGDPFESILTVSERWLSEEVLTFDSIAVTLNDTPIEFETKKIGNANQMWFTPKEQGVYKYTGVVTARNVELDYEFSCGFEYDIVSQ